MHSFELSITNLGAVHCHQRIDSLHNVPFRGYRYTPPSGQAFTERGFVDKATDGGTGDLSLFVSVLEDEAWKRVQIARQACNQGW